MKKIKVAVFFGGKSSEYEISLKSAYSVFKYIDKQLYEIIMIGITKKGDFYLYEGDIEQIKDDSWYSDKLTQISINTNSSVKGLINLDNNSIIAYDVAFPILHGKNGEDGRIQAILELTDTKYVGCGMISSALCMDKEIAHELVEKKGIHIPKSIIYSKYDSIKILLEKAKALTIPLYVKPVNGGSSIGISKIYDLKDLKKAIDLALSYDQKIIIEEHIEGIEVGCAIMGEHELIVSPIDEIKLNADFNDFEQKYESNLSEIRLKTDIDQALLLEIQKKAIQIYKTLNCKGLARIDLFLTKDHKIYFNEVNTMPGFTEVSRFPKMLNAIGYSFSDIINYLIQEAFK